MSETVVIEGDIVAHLYCTEDKARNIVAFLNAYAKHCTYCDLEDFNPMWAI